MKPPARKRKEPPKYSESGLGLSDIEDDKEVEEAAPCGRKLAKFMESDEELTGDGDDEKPEEGGKKTGPVSEPDAVSEAPLAMALEEDAVEEAENEKAVNLVKNTYSEAAKAEMLRVVVADVPCQCGLEEPRCGEGCSNRRERRECSPSLRHGVCSNMVSSYCSLDGIHVRV